MVTNEHTENVQITFSQREMQALLASFANLGNVFVLEDIELSLGNPEHYVTAFFVKHIT